MSFRSNYVNLLLQSSCFPSKNLAFIHRNFQIRGSRFWRRRRLKLKRSFAVRNEFGPIILPSFEDLFQNLISQFPSVNSLDLIAPALGLASGVTLYLSNLQSQRTSGISDIGEWILFTSPTPFNRFVLLRCPSIQFEGSELLQDVNEKLVKEDRHFVNLNKGRIQVRDTDRRHGSFEEKLVYQRVCVSTDDGGVISLDWPANLDLTEERGMDTTMLLVPGTPEGSMDKNVRLFVCESLKRGCFPVVMNPRGCAGSPLTTSRLFTAADSDDICTAIQFINQARPWTTLMGVGWGYGANMLTKYLAEVGERTPLTAATCIDNPFDLEEATRSSPYHIAADQKLTGGLIDILRSNKELFQGRTKGFNVEKALSATSVRDFEKAISMVSYGFEAIEEFYAKSSTRKLVGNVKIPVLFIQSDEGTVPIFSIPRSSIAENPFTSMLLCSCMPSTIITSSVSAISWCQHLSIEWLTAVELGLLKGRHPLLEDVDVTINPTKGLALVEGRASDKSKRRKNFLNLTPLDALNGYSIDLIKDMLEESDTARSDLLRSGRDLDRKSNIEGGRQKQDENSVLSQQNSSVDAELVEEEGDEDDAVHSERGQVLQTAQVVINMLDASLPGTLAEDQKKKVLTAVEQGETLMKALEGAVPEDVRGKLTTSVSEILQTQGTNLNLDGLMRIGRIPKENFGGQLSSEVGSSGIHSLDHIKKAEELSSHSDNNQPDMERKYANESEQNHEKDVFSKERAAQFSEYDEIGSEKGGNPNHHSRSDKASGTEEVFHKEEKVNQGNGIPEVSLTEVNDIQNNEEKSMDSSSDQNKPISSTKTEEALPPVTSSPESSSMEKEGNDNQTKEEKILQPVTDHNKQGSAKSEEPSLSLLPTSNSPSLSVSQALDALTGIDDSTQMAVNSVFGVIENMITQLEEEKDNKIDGKHDKNKEEDEDEKSGSASEPSPVNSEFELEKKEDSENGMRLQSDLLQSCNLPDNNFSENCAESHQDARNGYDEKKPSQNPASFFNNSIGGSQQYNLSNHVDIEDKKRKEDLTGSKFLAENLDKSRLVHKLPLYVAINPYRQPLYNEYLRKYLLSKMSTTKSLDLDTSTDLLLYIPEEGQQKLMNEPRNSRDVGVDGKGEIICSTPQVNDMDKIIEPSYVILDTEKEWQPIKESETVDNFVKKAEIGTASSDELMQFIKNIILDSLKVEVGRRLGALDMEDMESNLTQDLEQVADAVALAVVRSKELTWSSESKDHASGKVGTLHVENIINTISSAVEDANYLRKILPIGVIIGSSLATLRKYFDVATLHDDGQNEGVTLDQTNHVGEKYYGRVGEIRNSHKTFGKKDRYSDIGGSTSSVREKAEMANLTNDTVMVGAVTAALGASALLVPQQRREPYKSNETTEVSSRSLNEKEIHDKDLDKLQEAISEKNQNNIVSSLAEKAISVAGPVVPTKSGGEVDQERLVAMLADLGQKGGMLRLIGKIALLWGGIRGAMSLTDRLILFLRFAERPLLQRILGFVCMVLVLWSPVVVPLFPRLVQSWAAHNSSGIAEYACIIGLYTAVMILIMLWGKRIRGYENPLEQYGLDLTSIQKFHDFLKGLIIGASLVVSIHSINALLGCACISWPNSLPSSSVDAMALLKVYGRMLILTGQGIVTAIGVAITEELLFRSWLPEEIAVDLGYYQALIISGLAFSIVQRSPRAIPGLWLLSLALSGIRQRNKGSLSIPIGMRAGMVASNFILKMGGFLTYRASSPLWLTGSHPFQPFSGTVGLATSLLLAIALYPRQPIRRKKISRAIREWMGNAQNSII